MRATAQLPSDVDLDVPSLFPAMGSNMLVRAAGRGVLMKKELLQAHRVQIPEQPRGGKEGRSNSLSPRHETLFRIDVCLRIYRSLYMGLGWVGPPGIAAASPSKSVTDIYILNH